MAVTAAATLSCVCSQHVTVHNPQMLYKRFWVKAARRRYNTGSSGGGGIDINEEFFKAKAVRQMSSMRVPSHCSYACACGLAFVGLATEPVTDKAPDTLLLQ
jgi:hypothetical protein